MTAFVQAAGRASVEGLPPGEVLFGQTEAMRCLQSKLYRVAAANVPVLIIGESGTGKDLIAKLIHQNSPWSRGPFVKVDCPSIPTALLESELFGYQKGAFTGAYGDKPGRVEMANRGTLFFDEIAELGGAMQAKLLQLLQDGAFSRIGAESDSRVEVRVVCSTSRDMKQDVEAGNFRRDLFYRINVVCLELPPLRERVDDIPQIANYLLAHYNKKFNCSVRGFSERALQSLQRHDWPGNIRELENLVKRYVIMGSEDALVIETIRRQPPRPQIRFDGPISLKKLTKQAMLDLEREIICKALEANHWNRRKTARSLDISYRALLYKLRDAGVPLARRKTTAEAAPGNGTAN